ncbi:MAG: CBS domain-containing protein [Candidatus Methanoplasma sp.]|jgi:predicted transcriptional regulator|nr:CBS domain-containing protein [Candidatus Methanoplasma sp.]
MGVEDLEDLKKLSILRSQLSGITVRDIMTSDFPTVGPEDRVSEALSTMRDSGFQEIPIVESGNYAGMVSYGSILRKGSVTPDTKVKNLVRNLPTVSLETDITKIAEHVIANNCRQLAVLNGKKVIGMVSRGGLTKVAAGMKILKDIKVWEIMTTPVEYVKDDGMLDDALEIMRSLDIRTVPVVNSNMVPVGIVGMKEIIDTHWKTDSKSFGDFKKSSKAQITIESVCTGAIRTVEWDDTVGTAVSVMEERGISTLPVVEGKELVGMLTEYDIVELISACRERDALFVQISGLDEEDKFYADAMYADIEAEMARISKIYKPESLSIHIARYNEGGDRKKYSLTARLFIHGTVIDLKEVGWDLVKANNDLMKKMGHQVIGMKDSNVTFRKRKK